METSYYSNFKSSFLGHAPSWYKTTIIFFILLNPFLLWFFGPTITGWAFVAQFIFTLAMALKCYPLQPGGLLAIEAIALGMTSSDSLYSELSSNLPVILLLMFMVAGIFFMKDLLLMIFTKILLGVKSKTKLSLIFCFTAAILSAFLDALTVTAVIIAVSMGFYTVYHRAASDLGAKDQYSVNKDDCIKELARTDLNKFRAFLRSLLMHGAIGTALGGVATLVGEPQNLLIAKTAGWDFVEFFLKMLPVSLPTIIAGLTTCLVLEKTKSFGYGAKLPTAVRNILQDFDEKQKAQRNLQDKIHLIIQAVAGILLVFGLAFHVAEVGLVGLMVIILITSFTGITDEHRIGKAFQESLPFTALLVVFFTIVSVIHEQHLFSPIIEFVFSLPENQQPAWFFVANGVLSMISDNVFVATIYITEVKNALDQGIITRDHFETLAISINTGTNLPSIATPNGQAAFLFLLTSAISPLVRLSYGRMVIMALPYTIVISSIGLASVINAIG